MKKGIFFMCFLLMMTPLIRADIYIKEKEHTDSYYDGGVLRPAEDVINEFWISDKKMAYFTPGRIIIIDRSKSLMTFINRRAKTYVESPLPVDMSLLVPEQILSMMQNYQTRGTVEATGETKKVDQWSCRCYLINVDSPYCVEIKVWSTTDVFFDWRKLRDAFANVRRVANDSEDYIKALGTIEGYGILSEVTVRVRGMEIKADSRVVEISEKDPPENVYTVPEGYAKQEKLTIQDLRIR